MYNLPYFKEGNQQVILEFIHQHPFAFMVGCDPDNRPVATQVPVFMEEKEGRLFLTGHIMRNTDHHKAFEGNPAVLCVFTGAHTYVSAAWYADPHQASTWNYMSVHVRGRLRFLSDEDLINVLRKTTLHFENNNAQSPTTFDNLPADYTTRLMKAIVAFEIEVESIENVFKLSQNRDRTSYGNIMSELVKQEGDAGKIAEEMKKREPDLLKDTRE